VAKAKATKVMISMPEDLLERVDRAAAERGKSRSAFLQEVVRHELGWPDPVAFDTALERGRRALARVGAFESTELIREQRDARDERDRRR
jgi:predicted DNA-binding protein